MSTYVLMKIFESAPSRYDKGIQLLTFGKLDKIYDQMIAEINEGKRVLDIGCGTGALTIRAAQNGATVKAIDINAQMLEMAKERAENANLTDKIEFSEMGVAELGSEDSNSYDYVVSGLCFSELSADETGYALQEIKRILKLGGELLIADEVHPQNLLKRLLSQLIRIPAIVLTYILTQTTTKAVDNLPSKITTAGLHIESLHLKNMDTFIVVRAKKIGEQ